MGRYVSIPIDIPNYLGFRDVAPNFGSCNFRLFTSSGSFCVPKGVDKIRVTALGAGGTGGCFCAPCLPANPCCYQCLLNCGCCCPDIVRGLWAGPGGGGGGYVVATVTVTSGCVCCIVVGAAGGGTTCFSTAVIAYGGCPGCICSNGCCGCGGLGGSFCVDGVSATCLVGYCGNKGNQGYGCLNTGNGGMPQGQCSRCIFNPFPVGPANCSCYSCFCLCPLAKVNSCCFAGGASGSFLGGNYIGPWPGALCSDILSGQSVLGTNCIDSCVAAICGITIRWCGEMLLSTYICSIFGCNNVVPAVAACAQTGAPYPWCLWCSSVFGGAAAHCFGGDISRGSCYCCVPCSCPNATCTFAACNICGCAEYVCLYGCVVKAGCGGGGAGQYPGMIIYCHCYCTDNQYFTCCCFYINCCPFCNLAGCPGNGYLVIEW